MDTNAWHRIGYVMKKCGLRGNMKIYLEEQIPEATQVLFIAQQNRPTPFFIEKIAIVANTATVKLEEINTPETASQLSQQAIYLPRKNKGNVKKNREHSKKSIVGYRVIHRAKTLGVVNHLNNYAPNPLLTVSCANKEILIPLNDYFVRKIDSELKEITVILPEGFLTI